MSPLSSVISCTGSFWLIQLRRESSVKVQVANFPSNQCIGNKQWRTLNLIDPSECT